MIVVAGFVLAGLILAVIVLLLIRRQLREKYAFLWLSVGAVLVVISVCPGLFVGLTRLLGVQIPANLLFAVAIVLLLGVALHHAWELSRAEEEIRRLAEEHAILRLEVDRLIAAGGPVPSSKQSESPPGTPADEDQTRSARAADDPDAAGKIQ